MSDLVLKKNTTSGITLGIKADKRKYKLDSTAIGFSLLSNKRVTNVFRIECILKEEVELERLRAALANILPRFPYFRVSIKRGFIWGKWVTNLAIPEIQSERQYPCQYIPFGRKKLLYRIIVTENKIALECQHCLTDGHGGLVFLNSIVAEYLRIKGVITKDWEGIFLPEEKPDPLEYEDAYEQHYKKIKRVRGVKFRKRSFTIPNKIEPPGVFHTSKVIVSLETIKQKSKEFNVSLTALLIAIYFESLKELQEKIYKNKTRKPKPIRIRVPVNLRQIFESKTMRNFSLGARLDFDSSMDTKTFRERVEEIKNLQKNQIHPNTFYHKIAMNIGNTKIRIMQITPYQVKRFFARRGYYFISAPYYSGVISNLGKVTIPDQLVKYIDSYEVAIGPSAMHKERVGLISFEDKLVITFSRVIKEPILAEIFIRKLEELGIKTNKL
ncbi:MAG: hypothetical protein H7641_02815 [Candidatus Heimdallarchaeota archaeon]|nr:hypothetical protein [Candidatus Heimdallarchaeota archaeon]MCK4876495.1 hypothetical protein [Candidatus Heimdallarchaeota archaeon]